MKQIHLWGVKQNNLKNVEIKVPLGQITVVCGPSGSGKSSLAFDTLFAEGQRRFIESMSNYTRQFLNKAPKPDIEGISNIPPSIAIEQKNSIRSSRSTVGTVTELVDYLRLLFEKLGQFHCPDHHIPTFKYSPSTGTDLILRKWENQRGYILVSLDTTKLTMKESKVLLARLIQDGILRIALPKSKSTQVTTKRVDIRDFEVVDLSSAPLLKKGLPKGILYPILDRLVFSKGEAGRLADSLSLAFDASVKWNPHAWGRSATLATTEGESVFLSDKDSCPQCGIEAPLINSKFFSFNSPVGACPDCKGFGNILLLDEKKIVPDPTASIEDGALNPFTMPSAAEDKKDLLAFCRRNKIPIDISWQELSASQKKLVWSGDNKFYGVQGLFDYLETKKYKMHVRVFLARYRSPSTCPKCQGSRLRQDSNWVLIANKNINDLTALTIQELRLFLTTLDLNNEQRKMASEILRQLLSRLDFLKRVGVQYLTLRREARTLSGGEFQRLNLANQLGMGLSQVLYVLDEPTVGLHPRDNDRLISVLKSIKELGNTLVVVEHDYDVIKSSDQILEMGPGSGSFGGQVIYAGSTEDFLSKALTTTSRYLSRSKDDAHSAKIRPVDLENYRFKLTLKGATGNNLKNISVDFPLNRMVAITGVSGSGKSSLITKTLYPALAAHLKLEFLPALPFKELEGLDLIKNVVLIDQSSIGKSARSSPITYMKAFDGIRSLMATTHDSLARGYTPGTFSLNVDGGRCPSCKGTGFEEIDMMFMDNILLPCDVCDSQKFRPEVLEVRYKGKNIAEILELTVLDAMEFFIANPSIRKPLSLLKEVGLDYLKIGQRASSLSGGEAQRLKIAKELSQSKLGSTLYILDEPTTGLHFKEIQLLLGVLHKLIDAGGSVLVIEHNLDVIKSSDYVIDIGPDGGEEGGSIVFAGPPEELAKDKMSLTGQYLQKYNIQTME